MKVNFCYRTVVRNTSNHNVDHCCLECVQKHMHAIAEHPGRASKHCRSIAISIFFMFVDLNVVGLFIYYHLQTKIRHKLIILKEN